MRKLLTLTTFLLLAAGCGKPAAPQVAVTVRTARPEMRVFQEAVATQGVVEAADRAVLSAQTAGNLELLTVKEGDAFKKGQLLFRSDRRTLENRYTLAAEALKMAEERVRTRQADVEVAKVVYEKAVLDFERNRTLLATKAVSKNAYEAAEVNYRKGKLAISQAEAALATSRSEVSFAAATLEIARKHLNDAEVHAPYDGVVSAKLRQENEFCNAGTPVLKIERPAKRRIAVELSGLHYGRTAAGSTRIAVAFGGRTLGTFPVTVKGSVIDPASRTFELKADLPDEFELPSGTLCDVKVVMAERSAPALPEDAILFRKNGFAVYVCRDGRAEEVRVTPGVAQQGWTELIGGEALETADVIVSGQYFVNPGTRVKRLK